MKMLAILRQSLVALAANKGRSLLTVLGIVIGIGSVIALVSLGAGARASISGQISALGTTNLAIMPGFGFGAGPGGGGGPMPGGPPHGSIGPGMTASKLTEEDLALLSDKSKHPQIDLVAGQVSGSEIFGTPEGDQRYSVLGTSESYFEIQGLTIDAGGLYGQDDATESAQVVVLGSQLANEIYGSEDPLGNLLMIAGMDYRVIGVLKPAAENRLANPNRQAYIPYTAAFAAFRVQAFDLIQVRVMSEEVVETVRQEITASLLASHGISEERLADFNVSSSADLLSLVNTITGTLTALLAAIAAISLLVGGIGIMNIMLVSVTERTREIGLRKAVGANEADILSQFIVEAVLLTVTGGILGIGLGAAMGRVGGLLIGSPPVITIGSAALAVGVSTVVGLVFGVYPAARAAALNPIDALRYE